MLQAEALKFNTRLEFAKNSNNAYQIAHERSILDKICAHMVSNTIYWTNEMLTEEALKFETRGEFRKKSPSAYTIAITRNILDLICAHMIFVHVHLV